MPGRFGWLRNGSVNEHSTWSELLRFLLFGFLGGFILNLMPCVLPVISLKIFGFIQHAGQSRGRILRSGLAFIAGIFAWFIGLALLLIVLKSAGPRNHLGVPIHQSLFRSFHERGCARFRAQFVWRFRNLIAAKRESAVARLDRARRRCRFVFPGRFRDRARDSVHRAVSRHGSWVRLHPVGLDDFRHVPRDRRRHELALSPALRATRLAASAARNRAPWMERVKQLMGFFLLATLLFLLWVIGAERGVEAIYLDLPAFSSP